jgi:hypothetical protein
VFQSTAFQPTHLLVSRTRQVPVQLIKQQQSLRLATEAEWQSGEEPAFEFQPKRGFFCKGIQIVGYSLQPIAPEAAAQSEPAARTTKQKETASTSV